jgi:hypothetical protein
MSATRSDAHTLTTREVMKIFEVEGIPRAQRSIERYCQEGDLDCMPDAVEKRLYITRSSVDTLIGQLKEIAARHPKVDQQISPTADDATRPAATTAPGDGMKQSTPEKQGEKQAGEYAQQLAEKDARIKELEENNATLEDKNFNLQINDKAKEQVINLIRSQWTQQNQEFTAALTETSKRVGQLETEMRQLMAPDRDRRPTSGDRRRFDDGEAIDAEYRAADRSPASTDDAVSTNAPQP